MSSSRRKPSTTFCCIGQGIAALVTSLLQGKRGKAPVYSAAMPTTRLVVLVLLIVFSSWPGTGWKKDFYRSALTPSCLSMLLYSNKNGTAVMLLLTSSSWFDGL